MHKTIDKQAVLKLLQAQVGSSVHLQVHHAGLIFARSAGKLTNARIDDDLIALEIDRTTIYIQADMYDIRLDERLYLQVTDSANGIVCDITPLQQTLPEEVVYEQQINQ